MDKKNTQYFKDRLVKAKEELTDTLKLMEENGEGEQDRFSSGELSSYDNHPAELGTAVFQVTMDNALKVNEEYNIGQINNALDRIADGTYGVCQVCGKDIDFDRLDALPFARRCIECEKDAQIENGRSNTDRPVEELIWDSPMGRKYLNNQEDDEYEGLDYFNDLEKYGSSDSPQDMGGYAQFKEFYTNEVDRQGMTNDIENISNEDYEKQLPD